MKASLFYQHIRLKKWLPLFAAAALPEALHQKVAQHLLSCEKCQRLLADIEHCREIIQTHAGTPDAHSRRLWHNIQQSISMPAAKPVAKWYQQPAFQFGIAALVFFFSIFGVNYFLSSNAGHPLPNIQAEKATSAFNFGLFIDAKMQEKPTDTFYNRYETQTMHPQDPACCSLLKDGFFQGLQKISQLECIRLIKNASNECTEVVCIIDGKPVTIFQQKTGQAWNLGNFPFSRENIMGKECLIMERQDIAVVNWQEKDAEYLILGNLNRQKISRIIQSLK